MRRALRPSDDSLASPPRGRRAGTLLAIPIALLLPVALGVPAGARADEPPPAAGAEAAGKEPAVSVGGVAPEFSLPDLGGKTLKLSEALKKGPVLLDFWALWCKPCLEALPGTDKLRETYAPRGLTVFAVNTDSPKSSAKVKSYVKSKGFGFTVLTDPNNTMQRLYRFYRIPQLYLIASDGTIVHSQLGYSPGSEERLAGEIEKLVGAAPAATGSESGGQ